ncbi:MAG: hypothetical protein MJZ45_02485 [Bacteroidales bacterium]|nr:hypothetical protein [Bacteroidales bacterium]
MDCSRLFFRQFARSKAAKRKSLPLRTARAPENKHIVRTVSTLQRKKPFSLFFMFKNIKKQKKTRQKA